MSLAYILLKCNDGTEKQVLGKIKTISEVKETQETFGPYDAVVKLESDNVFKIKQILYEKINHLNGVGSSTMLMSPFESDTQSKTNWEDVRGLTWLFYDE